MDPSWLDPNNANDLESRPNVKTTINDTELSNPIVEEETDGKGTSVPQKSSTPPKKKLTGES